MTKRYDPGHHPQPRAERHDHVTAQDKTIMNDTLDQLNPAAAQRHIQALTAELLTLTTTKPAAARRPTIQPLATRASADESTTPATRAS